MAGIDPPIIVTGGGGDSLTSGSPRATNTIQVNCDPAAPTGPKKFKTKVNKDEEITSVLLEFPDMSGQRPIIISGYDTYNIKITFNTAPKTERKRPIAPGKRKEKKKDDKKRPPARKGK